MITFKINKVPYRFPSCWEDVTYNQYLALLSAVSLTDQISIFTGVPRETLDNAELKNLEKIILALSFLSLPPKFVRTELVGKYYVPKDVTIESTGQFEDLRGLLAKMPKNQLEEPEAVSDLYLEACAIYCQKLRDGKYDYSKVSEVKEELKDCSCAEVIGTGAFFLFRPWNLSRRTMSRYQKFTQLLRNMIQGSPGYRRISVSLQRLFGLVEK